MDKGRISHFTLRVLALFLAAALCAAVPAMAEETPQTRTLRFEALKPGLSLASPT